MCLRLDASSLLQVEVMDKAPKGGRINTVPAGPRITTYLLLLLASVLFNGCADGNFKITEPANNSHVQASYVHVRGTANANAEIMEDVRLSPDSVVTRADQLGNWDCYWFLHSGKNTLRLHTKGHENHRKLTVYFEPSNILQTPKGPLSPSCTAFPF